MYFPTEPATTDWYVNHLSLPHAQRVVQVAAPGLRVLAVTPARFAFTNAVHLVDTKSTAGRRRRLVVKLLTDDPDPERATAEFTSLRIAHHHGIPVPEPVYLDADYVPLAELRLPPSWGSRQNAKAAFFLPNHSYVIVILDPGPSERAIDREIPMERALNELPEAFVSHTAISRAVSRAVGAGRLRKLASRLYTSNLDDAPEGRRQEEPVGGRLRVLPRGTGRGSHRL